MLNIGPQEVLLILIIALVVVGPQRLPELARSIGKALRSLRAAQDDMRRTVSGVLEPEMVKDVTKDLRRTGKEVRDSLRLDAPTSRPIESRRDEGSGDASPSTETPGPGEGPVSG